MAFNFAHLRTVLEGLPLPLGQPPLLDFRCYTPSAEGLEYTESINGAVNYDLERLLGHKVKGIVLTEGGPGIVALADVLERYVKDFPADEVLQLWGPAVLSAAENSYVLAGQSFPTGNTPGNVTLVSNSTEKNKTPRKRYAVEVEDVEDVDSPPPKHTSKRKKKSDQDDVHTSSVPPWIDIPETRFTKGRPADPLAREISVYCYDSRDSSKALKVRCVGSTKGCPMFWTGERNKGRVYKHASTCTFINSSLRQQVNKSLANNAPSALIEASLKKSAASSSSASSSKHNLSSSSKSSTSSGSNTPGSSLFDRAMSAGRQQLKLQVDFDLVKYICAAGLPPTSVDREEFKTMLEHLNSSYKPPCSTTIADTHIPAEAANVITKSIEILKGLTNLTLTLDGGSTRRSCSVYTFHVATPERRSFLMRGENVSTQSHTGENISSIAWDVISQIGPDRFSAVVTDGASNVVRARKLLVEKVPTMLNLTDPVHKISLLIKDICKLEEFKVPISNLRRGLNFFAHSDYATCKLTERRLLLAIMHGLETIGRTRFGTVVISADSMLRCMPPIRELVSEGTFEVKGINHLFMGNSPASIQFEMQLTVFTALLNPLVRALTCMESASCTPADVLLFFSAALGSIERHLTSGSHGLSRPDTVESIRKLCNKRFNELINESPDDPYVTSFYLDPYYRNSRLLRNINPLSIKITLNSSDEFSSHAPTVSMLRRIGTCLFGMLRKEWDNNPKGFVRTIYTSPVEAKDALRQQLLLYAASTYPFSEKISNNASADSWWMALADHPMSRLLAYFAIKLFSITPNSMADERTVSTFTWLNSALRNRQDVATIVRQTQIRQFYSSEKQKQSTGPVRIRYREVKRKQASDNAKAKLSKGNTEKKPESDPDEYPDNADEWLDGPSDPIPMDWSGVVMEIGDLVDLDAPEVEDCLSDEMPKGLLKRQDEQNDEKSANKSRKTGEGDTSTIEWTF